MQITVTVNGHQVTRDLGKRSPPSGQEMIPLSQFLRVYRRAGFHHDVVACHGPPPPT